MKEGAGISYYTANQLDANYHKEGFSFLTKYIELGPNPQLDAREIRRAGVQRWDPARGPPMDEK